MGGREHLESWTKERKDTERKKSKRTRTRRTRSPWREETGWRGGMEEVDASSRWKAMPVNESINN